ncbi:hypothetical protein GGR54DRAFT_81943 [Hypoxylon sp. NC1633]|nr:hypothetical protein GGR54DRAFT_81943 [Hypoxylon sp. NC1633]
MKKAAGELPNLCKIQLYLLIEFVAAILSMADGRDGLTVIHVHTPLGHIHTSYVSRLWTCTPLNAENAATRSDLQ